MLVTGSMGMRRTGVQVRPSLDEVVITMSLLEQDRRKRQSGHVT